MTELEDLYGRDFDNQLETNTLTAERDRLREAASKALVAIGDNAIAHKIRTGSGFNKDDVAAIYGKNTDKQLEEAFYALQQALKGER